MTSEESLTYFGYRFGPNGPHAARTIMFKDLAPLLDVVPKDAGTAEYRAQIVDVNLLAKPTQVSRRLSFEYLRALYSLDPDVPLFRVLRTLYAQNPVALPQLALLLALVRDPLLRATEDLILDASVGEALPRSVMEQHIATHFPDRFSPVSLTAFAQRVNGSWTQAGLLRGQARKVRSEPPVSAEAVVYALVLARIEGATGGLLFESPWIALLGITPATAVAFAAQASSRGIITLRNAGGVKEVSFGGLLTTDEIQRMAEPDDGTN